MTNEVCREENEESYTSLGEKFIPEQRANNKAYDQLQFYASPILKAYVAHRPWAGPLNKG